MNKSLPDMTANVILLDVRVLLGKKMLKKRNNKHLISIRAVPFKYNWEGGHHLFQTPRQ